MNSPERHWTDRLSEHLDGDLTATEREACEAHLAACADCARLLEELKAVAAEARALPAVPPPAELWRGIEARLETPVLAMRPRASLRERLAQRWSLSGLQLAGAAAALVAVTVGAMWLASSRGPAGPGSPGGAVALRPEGAIATTPGHAEDSALATPGGAPGGASLAFAPGDEGPAAPLTTLARRGGASPADPDRAVPAAAADFGVRRYDAAIAELEEVLEQRRSRLNPETVRIVEANLAIVDKAIDEARTALAADPASHYLNTHLANTMRRKVDLLRRLNSLTRV